MTSSVFLDINVWVALTLNKHVGHIAARAWYEALPIPVDLVFCRFTQLGLLRLLTTKSIVDDEPMSQARAWEVYDVWIERGGAVFQEEPSGVEIEFRALSNQKQPAPKDWADSYLAAFAASTSLKLVTFDRSLSERSPRSTLLKVKP